MSTKETEIAAQKRAMAKEEMEYCRKMLDKYRHDLKFSEDQLKYWELQFEAARTLSTRLMLDGSKKES